MGMINWRDGPASGGPPSPPPAPRSDPSRTHRPPPRAAGHEAPPAPPQAQRGAAGSQSRSGLPPSPRPPILRPNCSQNPFDAPILLHCATVCQLRRNDVVGKGPKFLSGEPRIPGQASPPGSRRTSGRRRAGHGCVAGAGDPRSPRPSPQMPIAPDPLTLARTLRVETPEQRELALEEPLRRRGGPAATARPAPRGPRRTAAPRPASHAPSHPAGAAPLAPPPGPLPPARGGGCSAADGCPPAAAPTPRPNPARP